MKNVDSRDNLVREELNRLRLEDSVVDVDYVVNFSQDIESYEFNYSNEEFEITFSSSFSV